MCTLNGCDKLFELGYIGVGYEGRIVTVDKNSSHTITKDLSRRLAHLKGRNSCHGTLIIQNYSSSITSFTNF